MILRREECVTEERRVRYCGKECDTEERRVLLMRGGCEKRT